MSLFFDNLEHQRRLGARAVSAFSAGIALATVAAWATLHTSGLGAALAVAATVLMAVLSVSAEQSSTARMGQGVLLMAQVSLLVGAFSGNGLQIDMHMTYFAALGVLAIFADWTVILVAAATVAVHHLTLSFILPSLVFYGEAGLGRVLIHAVILIAEAAPLMWTAANNVRMLDEVKTSLSEADRATADARRAQDMAENAIKAENASRQALDAERNEGKSPREAIHQAALLRFRPILMTTLAALFGALPLMWGGGYGAELRQPLGVSIVGGLIASQFLTLFTTPVIYLAFDRLARRLPRDAFAVDADPEGAAS